MFTSNFKKRCEVDASLSYLDLKKMTGSTARLSEKQAVQVKLADRALRCSSLFSLSRLRHSVHRRERQALQFCGS